jgi:hypothetical protein
MHVMRHPNIFLQHADETLETYIWNNWNICLQHAYIVIATYAIQHLGLLLQHPDETLKTSVWNAWNNQNTVLPAAIAYLLGTLVASKLRLGGRREQWPSVDPSAGTRAGLPFLPTGELDGGASTGLALGTGLPCLPFRNERGGWQCGAAQDDGGTGAKNGG